MSDHPADFAVSALEMAPGFGRYVWDAQIGSMIWSPGLLRMFGRSEAPTMAGFLELVHADDQARVRTSMAAILASEHSYDQTFRIVRSDGAIRRVIDRGVVDRDASGAAIRIAGMNIDISDMAAPAPEIAADRPNSSGTWLRQIIEQAPAAFAMLDTQMNYLFVSARYCAIFGKGAAELVGHCHYDVLPQVGLVLPALQARVLAGDVATAEEQRSRDAGSPPHWVRWTLSPWRIADGSIGGTILILEQVTAQVTARRKLAESEARLADALQAGGFGIHDYDPRSGRVIWDATTRAMWGIPDDEEVTFATFEAGIDPQDMPAVQRSLAAALDPGGNGRYEAVYRVRHRETGAVRWIRADGTVTFDDGIAIRLVGTTADVTNKKIMEEQIQVLLGEVNHRTNNLLTVVQAIARQTGQGDPETFLARFDQRIAALAANQQLLVNNEWRGVDLSSLLRSQLAHFHDMLDSRIQLSGPEVFLSAAAAQTLGMAFHELATNAAKHGALSNADGLVVINWQVADGPGTGLSVEWRERGGPPVRPPRRTGFGTTVIGRAAETGLQGKVAMDFAAEGFVWRLECGPQAIAQP